MAAALERAGRRGVRVWVVVDLLTPPEQRGVGYVLQDGRLADILPVLGVFGFAVLKIFPAVQQIYHSLTQIRFTAGYGAEFQHESVAISHALLAATEKLKVIAAILPGPWNPALAAKQLATIDQLTGGRVAVNVVSGWFRGEFQAIGEPWLDHDERYRRSEEFIRALKGIWTQDNFTFNGDFYRFRDYTLKPKPLQQPHPEIFQGGSSRAARDMAARVSDWYFTNGNSVEGIKAQVDDLRAKAAANGHSVKVGVNAFIIARDTEEEARAVLQEIIDKANPEAVNAFGAEVKNTNQYTDEQRKEYIGGIVERIDVKWLKEPRQHELTITFRLPIVGDHIEWKNPKQKSQGYTLVEGQKTDVVTLSKRDGRG